MRIDYAIALFLHVMGAITLFIGVALELAIAARMRSATTLGQVREALWYGGIINRSLTIAPAVILLAGLYLMVTAWGASFAWLNVSLVVFIVLAVIGATVNAQHFASLGQAAFSATGDAIPDTVRAKINDARAHGFVVTMTALATAIVFMMTTKPNLVGALIAVAVAFVAGLFISQATAPTAQKAAR